MFEILRKIWKTGLVTQITPFQEAPSRFRGRPMFLSHECSGCGSCAVSCPSECIEFHTNGDSVKMTLSYASCIFCGVCADVCETQMIQMTNQTVRAAKNKNDFIQSIDVSIFQKNPLSIGKGE